MEKTLFFNGIDGSTGGYLLPPMSCRRFAAALERRRPSKSRGGGVVAGVDAADLASAGWGVVFPRRVAPEIREALKPLLDHRRARATRDDERLFRELWSAPGESALKFLVRHGSAPGPVEPRKLPHYLLLVGSPREVSFELQYNLGLQHAVGRLDLESPEDYARYAQAVVDAEEGRAVPPRRVAVFGTGHDGDPATDASLGQLARPLAAALANLDTDWRVDATFGPDATRSALADLLAGGEESPALLFTAGHAVGFRPGSRRQVDHQGALLCSDWPGPKEWPKKIPEDFYFAAHDLAASTRLDGRIAFHFACYSAGTPSFDNFATGGEEIRIAEEAFVSRLPRALLARGALAVVGHVDRAWEHSFSWEDENGAASPQAAVFESSLKDLLAGKPVGLALEGFARRYAELSAHLTQLCDLGGDSPELLVLEARLRAAHRDARGWVVLGDPAARLAAGPGAAV